MKSSRISLKEISFLASFIIVFVASGATDRESVNLEYLIEAAVQQHPPLALSHGNLEAGRINESSLPWWDAPELRLGYGRDSNVSDKFRSDSYPGHEYGASLRVFPKNPWEREAEQRKLRSGNRLLELSHTVNEQQISARVKELYWEACYVSAELDMQEQLLQVYHDQTEQLETLLAGGQITVSQSLLAKMKRLDTEMEVESLRRNYDDLCGGLGGLCGVASDSIRFVRPMVLTAAVFDRPYDEWRARAIEARTDVQRNGLLVENAKAGLDTIHASQIPWIKHVEAKYQVRNDYGDEDSAGVEIAINLPFFASDGGEQRMAARMLEAHRRQSLQARKMAEHEVQALIAEFHAIERQWQTQGSQITSMQNELSTVISKMEAQGSRANQNYWDAQITLLELNFKGLQLSRSFQQLLLKAEFVLGEGVL